MALEVVEGMEDMCEDTKDDEKMTHHMIKYWIFDIV